MGKIEELIEKYKQDKLMARGFIVDDLGAVYKEIDEVIEDLQQLKSSLPTQQDKVVVPEFVAEYLEMRKQQFAVGGLGVAIMHVFDGKESPKLFNWMNNNVEVFARAWLDDYTVEKAQLYYVELPEKNTDTYNVYGLKKYSDGKINVGYYDKKDIGKSINSKLTEKEIKSVHENYWAFAVPVEEDE